MFGHGFNIRFGTITPPKDVDVTMVAPKAPGHRVREVFVEGGGTPALLAIHQDATGKAKKINAVVCKALGLTRAGVFGNRLPKKRKRICLASRSYCVVASVR